MGQVRYELDSAPETTDTAQNVSLHESPWNLHHQKCNWSRAAARENKMFEVPNADISAGRNGELVEFFCSPRTNDNVNVAPTAENDRPDDSGILLIKLWTANLYRNVSITRKEKIHEATGLDLTVGFRQHRCRRQEETWVVLISIIQYLSRIVQKTKWRADWEACRSIPVTRPCTWEQTITIHQLHVKNSSDVCVSNFSGT